MTPAHVIQALRWALPRGEEMTSVDHRTAFDITGFGKADHGTMLSADLAAVDHAPCMPAIRAKYTPS